VDRNRNQQLRLDGRTERRRRALCNGKEEEKKNPGYGKNKVTAGHVTLLGSIRKGVRPDIGA
jgi:hypothetical protein